jgi:uncharacterized membrane-anchored protein YhcB (DUF1043 family)
MRLATAADSSLLGESSEDIRQELDRITTSPAFRHSLRLKRFIAFVVETTLAGKADRIKAYTIAVEALDRSADFDPQNDSIVRVEAGRLRHALARYYSAAGRDDPILIALPRGTYVPRFSRRPPKAGEGTRRFDRLQSDANAPLRQPGHNAEPAQQLARTLATLQQSLHTYRRQVQAVAAELAHARQNLAQSRELLQDVAKSPAACSPLPLLLRTPPSAQPQEIRAANGREEQARQQVEAAAAARLRRPWAGGDRGHPAHDGDDPEGLRALRIRAG